MIFKLETNGLIVNKLALVKQENKSYIVSSHKTDYD
jgi:hypothetical protein